MSQNSLIAVWIIDKRTRAVSRLFCSSFPTNWTSYSVVYHVNADIVFSGPDERARHPSRAAKVHKTLHIPVSREVFLFSFISRKNKRMAIIARLFPSELMIQNNLPVHPSSRKGWGTQSGDCATDEFSGGTPRSCITTPYSKIRMIIWNLGSYNLEASCFLKRYKKSLFRYDS